MAYIPAMQKPDIYNYTNPNDFLRDSLGYKCAKNPSFSVRSWAKQMGLKSHASLVFLLNGQRSVRPQHIEFLLKGLKLSDEESHYFSGLVQLHNSRSVTEQKYFESQLKELHPSREFTFLELEKFKLIANWYHMAILEMVELNDFKYDCQWISKRLGKKLTSYQVKEAIERLISLELLKEVDGELIKTDAHFTTPKGRSSESIREHHKQILDLAMTATDELSTDERYYNSCAMTIDSSLFKEAVELILSFRKQFAGAVEKKKGDETYQLSVQFFKLTNSVEGEK